MKFTKNGQETDFKWDNAGNLLQDDKATYTYNEFNQTTKVETFDGNVQINRYDAENLRYEMEENGQLVQFIYNTEREVFISNDDRVKDILAKHNVNGVDYKDGMPDFSPFTVGEVKINMTSNRSGDKGSYITSNYNKADEELAIIWSKEYNQTFTIKDVKNWRESNSYTWHELNDTKTMQLIPTSINAPIFKHLGGVKECELGGF